MASNNSSNINNSSQITIASSERKSIDNEKDDIKKESCVAGVQDTRDQQEQEVERAPHILESAPFPALGSSLDQVARILSKSTHASSKRQSMADLEEGGPPSAPVAAWEQPWPTEGIRNPGWLVVVSTFLVNFVVFGNTFSWGTFQRLYLDDVYKGQTDQMRISFVGTLANSLLLSIGVFLTPVISKFGFRPVMCVGMILCPVALILASFANQLWQLYLTQGMLFGIGGAFVFAPSVTLPSQWFYKNRGLATGIAVSGSGIGGVTLSPLTQHLISTVGYRNALRILACMEFGILAIGVLLARSRWRPPPSEKRGKGLNALIDPSMRSWAFLLLMIFAFLVPFGYVAPFFLTPFYAAYIGVDDAKASTLISIMSAMNAICRISLGFLADKTGRLNTMFACTFLAGLFSMVVWQFASNYGIFLAYCILYGLTGGGFVSLFPVVTVEVVGLKHIQRSLSLCYFICMFGNLVGSPIVGLLETKFGWTAAIQFAGAPSVAASLIMLALRFLLNRKIFARV